MDNGANWPLHINGRRYVLRAWVEKGKDGVTRLTVNNPDRPRDAGAIQGLEIPPAGLSVNVPLAGLSLTIVVGPALGHMLSLKIV